MGRTSDDRLEVAQCDLCNKWELYGDGNPTRVFTDKQFRKKYEYAGLRPSGDGSWWRERHGNPIL